MIATHRWTKHSSDWTRTSRCRVRTSISSRCPPGATTPSSASLSKACLIPNVVDELLKAYPDSPPAIEAVEYLANKIGGCQVLDEALFKTDEALRPLEYKLTSARLQVLDEFSEADLLQLT